MWLYKVAPKIWLKSWMMSIQLQNSITSHGLVIEPARARVHRAIYTMSNRSTLMPSNRCYIRQARRHNGGVADIQPQWSFYGCQLYNHQMSYYAEKLYKHFYRAKSGPILLLRRICFIPSFDKILYLLWSVRWNHFQIPIFAISWTYVYSPLLGLNLIHVDKMGHREVDLASHFFL